MTYDEAEKRLLTALWIDHHGPNRLIGRDKLASEYSIILQQAWLESFAATFDANGWVTIHRSLNDTALTLKAGGYRAGMEAALALTGGTSIMVSFDQKEIAGDGDFSSDFPGGPGWKYFSYDGSAIVPPSPRQTLRRRVALDHSDPDHKAISNQFAEMIRDVEGDNQLEGRDELLTDLRHAESLWSRTSIEIIKLKVGIMITMDDLCEAAMNAYYIVRVQALRQGLKAFAQNKLHIDIDNLF